MPPQAATPAPSRARVPVLLRGPVADSDAAVERRRDVLKAVLEKGFAVRYAGSDASSFAGGGNEALPADTIVLRDGRDEKPESSAEHNGVHDIASVEPTAVAELVESVARDAGAPEPGAWKPWFPVIDFERCTNCMQCLSFCLFDVYGVDADSQIEVKNPDKCKTNCPACSRVCPEVAILFPKYGAGPINGANVSDEDVEREKMKVDISALLGGDIYSALRERHRRAESRFSKERDESKALKERMRCLKKLQSDLDIPEEVLMSLPSMDEIRARAAEAGARGPNTGSADAPSGESS